MINFANMENFYEAKSGVFTGVELCPQYSIKSYEQQSLNILLLILFNYPLDFITNI